ncbi:hypothetical protein GCM10010327_51700 [Streptomyces nitrosporeus]|nr:hypothetical protein GCM10010327_51700 [Streptomyces nitrosporeus]
MAAMPAMFTESGAVVSGAQVITVTGSRESFEVPGSTPQPETSRAPATAGVRTREERERRTPGEREAREARKERGRGEREKGERRRPVMVTNPSARRVTERCGRFNAR